MFRFVNKRKEQKEKSKKKEKDKKSLLTGAVTLTMRSYNDQIRMKFKDFFSYIQEQLKKGFCFTYKFQQCSCLAP